MEARKLANDELYRIDQWFKESIAPAAERIEILKHELIEIHKTELELDPKATKIVLPHGSLVSSMTQERVEVEDLELFVKWAKTTDHKELIRVKEEADLIAVRKAVYQDGIEVEGVVKVPKSRKFDVKVG